MKKKKEIKQEQLEKVNGGLNDVHPRGKKDKDASIPNPQINVSIPLILKEDTTDDFKKEATLD